jgi:tetrahydromethanopterin S-methyltransferase subunit F
MKDLWKILTTDEDGVKYTTRDYVIGFAIALVFAAVLLIPSILE